MRKSIFAYSIIVGTLLSSCGGDQPEEVKEGDKKTTAETTTTSTSKEIDFSKMESLDLTPFEISATLKVPTSTDESVATVIHEEGDYRWDVTVGEKYNLLIELSPSDDPISEEKTRIIDLYGDQVEFIRDEADLIFYKAKIEIGGESKEESNFKNFHHVYAKINIGGDDYVFKTNDANKLSKARAMQIIKTIASAKM